MLVLVELPSHDFSQVEYIFTCGPCLILTPVNLHVYLSSSLLLLDPSPLQFYPHQFSLGGAILVLWIQPHHLSTLSKHSLLFHTRQVGPLNLSVLPHLKGQYSPTQRKGTSLITWVPSPSTHFYLTQDKWAHLTFQFYHILRNKTAPQGVQPHHLSTLSKHSLLSHTRQVSTFATKLNRTHLLLYRAHLFGPNKWLFWGYYHSTLVVITFAVTL